MSIPGSSSIRPWKMSRSSCTCTSSPQSVGGPRAGETGGGSSGSPRCVRIFRIGPGLGGTQSAGCRRHSSGTQAETPPPPGPAVSPMHSARCRENGACDARRSSLPWHAHRSQPHAACRCSHLSSAVTARRVSAGEILHVHAGSPAERGARARFTRARCDPRQPPVYSLRKPRNCTRWPSSSARMRMQRSCVT